MSNSAMPLPMLEWVEEDVERTVAHLARLESQKTTELALFAVASILSGIVAGVLDVLQQGRFGLLARSFYTETFHAERFGGHYAIVTDDWHAHPTSGLLEAIGESIPLVALANAENVHGGRPVESIWCAGDSWENVFLFCLERAEIVILFYSSETTSVQREIAFLDDRAAWSRTLLVTWEDAEVDERLTSLSERARWLASIPRFGSEMGRASRETNLSQLDGLIAHLSCRQGGTLGSRPRVTACAERDGGGVVLAPN